MMHTAKYFIFLLTLIVISMFSCKKDPVPPDPAGSTGMLTLKFHNRAGDSALVLNTSKYVNTSNDTFTVSRFDYYISNIELIQTDQSVYAESESYHLLRANTPGSLEFTITNVPLATYTGIRFMIGVDSTRNVSGAQTGALDPANGMFWSWNSGYIMAKLEAHTNTGVDVEYHIGGFSGANSALKNVSLSFNGQSAFVSTAAAPTVHLKANVLEWLTTPANVDFDTFSNISMPGTNAKMIADNYADMFSVVSIDN